MKAYSNNNAPVETSKFPPAFWLGLFTPALIAAVVVPAVLLRTWVLATLWSWYVVPAFGVQPLRMVYAFGLALLATYALPRPDQENDSKGASIALAKVFGHALAVLFMGWLGTWFI